MNSESNTSDASAPSPERDPGAPPRLTRPESGRLIFGVSAGLARYFGIDPVIVRIAFLVGIFLGGIGLVAYLAIALFVPSADDPETPGLQAPYQLRPWLGAIGGTVLVLALVPAMHGSWWNWGPLGLGWAILIAAVVLGAYFPIQGRDQDGDGAGGGRDREDGGGSGVAAGKTPPPGTPVRTADPVVAAPATVAAAAVPDAETTAGEPEAGPVPDRGPDGPDSETAGHAATTEVPVVPPVINRDGDVEPDGESPSRRNNGGVIAAIITASFFAFFGAATLAAFGEAEGVALVLVGVGAVLVIGGFMGRLRWLAVPLLSAALGASLVVASGVEVSGGIGEIRRTPVSAETVPADGYRLGIGTMSVDLRDFDWEETPVLPLEVEVGIGHAGVVVSENVCVVSSLEAGVGRIFVAGEDTGGLSVESEPQPASTATPRLELTGKVGAGEFVVIADDNLDDEKQLSTTDVDLDRQRQIRDAACSVPETPASRPAREERTSQ